MTRRPANPLCPFPVKPKPSRCFGLVKCERRLCPAQSVASFDPTSPAASLTCARFALFVACGEAGASFLAEDIRGGRISPTGSPFTPSLG